jgi:hypothetical protein
MNVELSGKYHNFFVEKVGALQRSLGFEPGNPFKAQNKKQKTKTDQVEVNLEVVTCD